MNKVGGKAVNFIRGIHPETGNYYNLLMEYPTSVIIPPVLLELSRKHDGIRYYIAECEAGKIALIEAQTLVIEMLLNELRRK
jgi:hypothetical protein